jgi:hypothetical protein
VLQCHLSYVVVRTTPAPLSSATSGQHGERAPSCASARLRTLPSTCPAVPQGKEAPHMQQKPQNTEATPADEAPGSRALHHGGAVRHRRVRLRATRRRRSPQRLSRLGLALRDRLPDCGPHCGLTRHLAWLLALGSPKRCTVEYRGRPIGARRQRRDMATSPLTRERTYVTPGRAIASMCSAIVPMLGPSVFGNGEPLASREECARCARCARWGGRPVGHGDRLLAPTR